MVVLQRKYDARRDNARQRLALEFRPWLFQRLRLAAVDEMRAWFGRAGQKRVFDERLLDAGLRESGFDDVDPGWIKPNRLPPRTRTLLELFEPSLVEGRTLSENRERTRLLRSCGRTTTALERA